MTAYTVKHGDSLLMLRELEADSVDAVITDPPYSSGGMTRGDRSGPTKAKYVQTGSGSHELGDFVGDNRDQRSFGYWCSLWFAECLRVAKDGGVLCSFIDWRQLPTITDAVQAGGWVWRGIVPWNKGDGTRPQKGRFKAQCEYIVFATKGPQAPYSDAAPCLPGFYSISSPRDRYHITQKPLALMLDIVRLAPPGGVVLDPFAGSGTTGVAAIREGRVPILFEATAANAAICEARIKAELEGLDLRHVEQGQIGLLPGGAS